MHRLWENSIKHMATCNLNRVSKRNKYFCKLSAAACDAHKVKYMERANIKTTANNVITMFVK